ncbi:MAG: multiple sugar transport system permease protein [Candidatus Atribacteria bacterium]|nr:multiple sugar transport system permease protein [Candidatus Atribacteria bacterium]
MRKRKVKSLLPLLLIVVGIIIVDFPLYWMFATSIRSEFEIFSESGTSLIPRQPTVENYKAILGGKLFAQSFNFRKYLWNSVITSLGATLVTLFIAILGGYSLARYELPVSEFISNTILFVYMFPGMIFAVPLLRFVQKIGLYDSLLALILVFTTFAVPFGIWMMRGYFKTIPKEVEECALIDGCSPPGVLLRISLPMAIPGIVATAIYTFILAWNDLLYPLIFVRTDANKTLTVGISNMVFGDLTPWGGIMAASVLSSLPVVLLFVFLQKYLVRGLTAGAVKE